MNTITKGGPTVASSGLLPIGNRTGSTQTNKARRTFHSEKAHKTASVMNDSVKAKSTPEYKKVNEALTDKTKNLNDSFHNLVFTVLNMKADGFDKKAEAHGNAIKTHLADTANAHLLEIEELKKIDDHFKLETDKQKPEELAKLQEAVFTLAEKYEEDMKGIKAKSGNSTDGDRTAEYVDKVLKETLENIKKFNPDYTSTAPETPQTPEQRIKALEDALKALQDKKWGWPVITGIAGLVASLGMAIASLASLSNIKNQFAKLQQGVQGNSVQIGQALTAVYNDSQQKIAALNEQISQLLNILNDAQDATMTLIKNITGGRQPQVAQAMHSSKTTAKRTFNSSRTMNAGEQTPTTAEQPGATNNANAERIAAATKKQAEITDAVKNAIPQQGNSSSQPSSNTPQAGGINTPQGTSRIPYSPDGTITAYRSPDGTVNATRSEIILGDREISH